MIDLRSDTVTRPTPGMRRAMMAAEVGDDVYREDPYAQRLQERVAELLGCEDSLFVPSGTMANELCIKAHTRPGDEVIVEHTAHIYHDEAGAPAALAGVQLRPVGGLRGLLEPEAVLDAIRPPGNDHFPRTSLVCLENPHNRGGGTVYPPEQVARIATDAHARQIRVHLDGARLLNAAVARNVPPTVYTRHVDSVALCLSKGLGAPVGSMVAGSRAFITDIRRLRKLYGGGMRQIGFLAAAGLYALDHHVNRLADDHAHARYLARQLADIPGLAVDPNQVETNMVYLTVTDFNWPAPRLVKELERKGIRVLALDEDVIRLVTHLDVSQEDMDAATDAFRRILAAAPGAA